MDKIPQQEIADARGITISAVEKHLQKAYKAIADVQRQFDAEDLGEFEPDADVAE